MKPYIIIPSKKNFEIILIKVPYDAIFWTIYHSFFNTNSRDQLVTNQTYSFVNGKLGDIVRLKLPPIGSGGNISFSGTVDILTGTFSSTKFNILYISVVEFGNYEVTINQMDILI